MPKITPDEMFASIVQLRQEILVRYEAMINLLMQKDADTSNEDVQAFLQEYVPELHAMMHMSVHRKDSTVEDGLRFLGNVGMIHLENLNNLLEAVFSGKGIDRFPREDVISALRSLPYEQYLKTHHWRMIRSQARTRADQRCQVCNDGEAELHVHHRTYERRGEELPEDVIVLCDKCHKLFHDNGKLVQS